MGGGLWNPEGQAVGRLRAGIDEWPGRWRRVLGEDGFKKMFLGEGKKGEGDEGAVKRFVERNKKGALKTKPKVSWRGYGYVRDGLLTRNRGFLLIIGILSC